MKKILALVLLPMLMGILFVACSKPAAKPDSDVAYYTCPMHPQIRQVGPGSCPICGMALEPVEVTGDAARLRTQHGIVPQYLLEFAALMDSQR